MSKRIKPTPVPEDRKLMILQTEERIEAENLAPLWCWIWTFSDPGWLQTMCDEGLLVRTKEGTHEGMGYTGDCALYAITDAGRALLKERGLDRKTLLIKQREWIEGELDKL